jgi:ubiquitin C-terminal hydrolase
VSLPPAGDSCTLEECLKAFASVEEMSGNKNVFCPSCNVKRDSTLSLGIVRTPTLLCIHIKRFSFNRDDGTRKLKNSVSYPVTGLNLGEVHGILSDAPPPTYNLVGEVHHLGESVAYGHYTAVRLDDTNADTPIWYNCDDESVTTLPDFLNSGGRRREETAYLLFYRLQPTADDADT